jgi:hypothetical protein
MFGPMKDDFHPMKKSLARCKTGLKTQTKNFFSHGIKNL